MITPPVHGFDEPARLIDTTKYAARLPIEPALLSPSPAIAFSILTMYVGLPAALRTSATERRPLDPLGAATALASGAIAPPGVAATDVLSLWALSCVLIGPDLAIVAPIAAGALRVITGTTVAVAFITYRRWGDAESRRTR